jgi:hypothetical protein
MFEKVIVDKSAYLKDNYPFYPIPSLTAKRLCIHCDKVIVVGEFKVLVGKNQFEYICCPNAPECNGTVIDWIKVPREKRAVNP